MVNAYCAACKVIDQGLTYIIVLHCSRTDQSEVGVRVGCGLSEVEVGGGVEVHGGLSFEEVEFGRGRGWEKVEIGPKAMRFYSCIWMLFG